jgi:hypothetical protein
VILFNGDRWQARWFAAGKLLKMVQKFGISARLSVKPAQSASSAGNYIGRSRISPAAR